MNYLLETTVVSELRKRARRALHVPDPHPERDALIAATAAAHQMTVVTRITGDFEHTRVNITDPWL